MAHKIEFTAPDEVNGKKYKKGDILSVSNSIYKTLNENGTVKDSSKEKSKSQEND